ncbi:hypothetical protein BVX97_04375 [bacterium E08(2017)]|nr:hypothetical protein BVX97_04375 [bacterium E08(2017)]
MIDFREELNDEQFAAVTAPDGPLLVLAAAGTGKTRTLVYRVAYLVDEGVDPDRILLLTFTNRAANEMLERARKLVGSETGGMWAGTFHHLCNRILRRYASHIGFKSDFAILDRDDSRTLMSSCIKELGFQAKDFPKREVLLAIAGSAANTETDEEEVVENWFADQEVSQVSVVKVLDLYRQKKRELGAMDFDDLLVNCLQLLETKEQVRDRYSEQFQYVLVDEYQDTNIIQAKLVDLLAGRHKNVMVVGDDFQSIYSWRGANFMNIMTFEERYPGARKYLLETNYRSVPEVLSVANACIEGNPDQFQKVLKPTRPEGNKPRVVRLRDGETQAQYVMERVHMLRREGYPLKDIAILYRAHFHAMELQIALSRERLPYVITSGVRFFEQAHVKDVCSLIKVMESSHDQLSFARLMQMLPGVGVKTAEKIWKKLDGNFDAKAEADRERLMDCLPAAALQKWKPVSDIMEVYDEDNLTEDPGEAMNMFVRAFYNQYAVNTFDNADRRLDDIQEMILFSSKYQDASEFLADITLLTNVDTQYQRTQEEQEDSLNLSTIHQAKGLEWGAVIMIWVAEGMFPSSRTLDEGDGDDSEERRLFYVAVTRAKDDLSIIVPEVRRSRDGGVFYCSPSRFVEEIPEDLVNEVRGYF